MSGSSLWVGALGAAALVPLIIFGLAGGAISDALDRRVVLLVSSVILWASTWGLLLQALFGLRSLPLIFALVALQSAGFAVTSPTRSAIIPRLLPVELVPSANTLNFTASNVGTIAGPLLAGVLIAHGRTRSSTRSTPRFTLSRSTRLCGSPRCRRPARNRARPEVHCGGTGVHRDPAGAARLLRGGHRGDGAGDAAGRSSRRSAPAGSAVARRSAGCSRPSRSGRWPAASRPAGSAGSAGRASRCSSPSSCWGVAVALAGLAGQLWLAVALLAVAGAADLVSGVYRQTILQVYAPDEMRGRMQGVFTVVVAGGPRLGTYAPGWSRPASALPLVGGRRRRLRTRRPAGRPVRTGDPRLHLRRAPALPPVAARPPVPS